MSKQTLSTAAISAVQAFLPKSGQIIALSNTSKIYPTLLTKIPTLHNYLDSAQKYNFLVTSVTSKFFDIALVAEAEKQKLAAGGAKSLFPYDLKDGRAALAGCKVTLGTNDVPEGAVTVTKTLNKDQVEAFFDWEKKNGIENSTGLLSSSTEPSGSGGEGGAPSGPGHSGSGGSPGSGAGPTGNSPPGQGAGPTPNTTTKPEYIAKYEEIDFSKVEAGDILWLENGLTPKLIQNVGGLSKTSQKSPNKQKKGRHFILVLEKTEHFFVGIQLSKSVGKNQSNAQKQLPYENLWEDYPSTKKLLVPLSEFDVTSNLEGSFIMVLIRFARTVRLYERKLVPLNRSAELKSRLKSLKGIADEIEKSGALAKLE